MTYFSSLHLLFNAAGMLTMCSLRLLFLFGSSWKHFSHGYHSIAPKIGYDARIKPDLNEMLNLKQKLVVIGQPVMMDCNPLVAVQFDIESSNYLSDVILALCDIKDDNREAAKILGDLNDRLENFDGNYSADDISRALYCIQDIAGDCSVVQGLLPALTTITKGCRENFDAIQLGMMFHGLQGLRGNTEAKFLVDFIYNQIDILISTKNKLTLLHDSDVQLLGKYFALTFSELREAFKDKHSKWEEINLLICDELAYRKGAGGVSFATTMPKFISAKLELQEYKYVTISSNYNLLAAYEFDDAGEGSYIAADIVTDMKVDASTQAIEGNARFCLSRDKHLRRHENGIEKIGAVNLRSLDDANFQSWLYRRLTI